jgi:hypothetical protein
VEAELHSLLGPHLDPFGALDPHFVVGRIPFALHNTLLMNDEILAVVANQNNIDVGAISNINLQWFYGFNDVDTFADGDAQAVGLNATIDYQRTFYEWTYAFTDHEDNAGRDSHYLALSRTAFYGPTSLALRALFKIGDEGGIGSGQLFVLESNHTRYFTQEPWGVEYGVFYANAFVATSGWSSMGGGNFNRIRSAFEVNPLIRISAAPVLNDTAGVACGVQLFRHHEDESLVPELSLEFPGGAAVFGVGLRYLRKTGPRTFLEVLGILNESDDPLFDRAGVLVCHTFIL